MKTILAACLTVVIALSGSVPVKPALARKVQSLHLSLPAAGGSAEAPNTCSKRTGNLLVQIKKTVSAVPDFALVNDAPFTRTTTRKLAVHRLYRIVCSLPVIRVPQRASCGADWGVAYHLTFWHGQARILFASIEAGGALSSTEVRLLGKAPHSHCLARCTFGSGALWQGR